MYTTAANPVSAAAALATLDVIENEHLMERSKELGEIAREFFEGAKWHSRCQRLTHTDQIRV